MFKFFFSILNDLSKNVFTIISNCMKKSCKKSKYSHNYELIVKSINFDHRQKEIQDRMIRNEIDLFLVTPSVDFGYLFKGFFSLSERLVCGIINSSDDAKIVAPSFEKERMQIVTTFDDVITWREEEDPYVILRNAISEEPKKIALESTTPFDIYLRIKKQFPNSEFVDGGAIFKQMRAIKAEEEIERMVRASNYTKDGILNAINKIEEGQTEIEALRLVQSEMTALSGEMGWAIVQFGENSAIPHGHPTKKKLKENEVVLIDAGTTCDHYFSDITVTTFFGNVTQEFLGIYEIVEEANAVALDTSKEGIPAEEVDFAARKIIESANYGKYFTHRLGHGLGLEVHEEPYIVKGNKDPLISGNVHTDEPGIYLPGRFGVRIEDDVLVGKKSKRLVELDRHIWK